MNKSPLKWAGGKFKLLPKIYSLFPKRENFIDVFSGSATVARNCEAHNIIINDINTDLYNLYYWLKHDSKKVIKLSQYYFKEKYCSKEEYLKIRVKFNKLKSNDIRRAALFIVLNKFGFNGMCRYNKNGEFNIPAGSNIKNNKLPGYPLKELEDYGLFLSNKNVIITQNDFEDAIKDLKYYNIYCDPPYLPLSTTASFTDYSKEGFTLQDQERLAECAFKASKNNNTIVISNHKTPEAMKIYKDADKIIKLSVQRSIAANSKKRKKAPEILVVYGGK